MVLYMGRCFDFLCIGLLFVISILLINISTVSVASAAGTAIIQRPSFTLKRIPGSNDFEIVFGSSLNVSNNLTGTGISSIDFVYTGGGALNRTLLTLVDINPNAGIDCNLDAVTCGRFIAKLLGRVFSTQIPSDAICVRVASLGIGNSSNSYSFWQASNGQSCTVPPPPDCVGDDCDVGEGEKPSPALACSVKTSSINLAFGNMSMGSAQGKTASGKINVNCNKDGAKLTMSLRSGGDSISLNNGMNAEITAGSKSLGTTISAVKGDNNITVQGTLKGTEKEGVFSGSGVLVTDYQ